MSSARAPVAVAAPAKNPAPKVTAGKKAPPKPGAKFLAPLPAAASKTPPRPSGKAAATQTPLPAPKTPKSLQKSKKAKKSTAVTPKQRAAREAQKELRRLRRLQNGLDSAPAKDKREPVKRHKKYNKLSQDSQGTIAALYSYFLANGKSTRSATAKVNKLLGKKKPHLLARSTLDNWHLAYTVARREAMHLLPPKEVDETLTQVYRANLADWSEGSSIPSSEEDDEDVASGEEDEEDSDTVSE